MNLLLIRHGQSTNNLLYAQTGASVGRSPDPPLTELGHAQAQALAEFAAHDETLSRLTHLYSSLTTRAVQTAAPLARTLGLSVQGLTHAHETQGLFEHDEAGVKRSVVGRTHADLQRDCRALLWPADLPGDQGWPGGFEPDDHAAFSTRARAVVDALLDAHGPDDRVGLVTHGNFTQFLLQELLGRPGGYFMTFNTATTCLTLMAGLQTTDAEVQNLTWLVRWVNRFDHLTPEQVSE